MKTKFYYILIFSFFALFISGCDEENEPNSQELELTTTILNNPSCKYGLKVAPADEIADTLSCVEYEYDASNQKLLLIHRNTGFNCCPEGFRVKTLVNENIITIQEFENEANCDCNCLYDLEIELTGVVAGEYTLNFDEPYAIDMQKISFSIDLTKETTGSFCVTRKEYPWGVYSNSNIELNISGEVIAHSECKYGAKSTSTDEDIPDSLSCVSYNFDKTNNILFLKHINAGFNCGPGDLYVETTTNGNIITIQEFESMAAANCNCLYDLDVELGGISEGVYQIVFIEPYLVNEQELSFTIDLTNNTTGEHCVTRKNYPWGVSSYSGTELDITGALIANTSCKSKKNKDSSNVETSDSLSCVTYSFDNSSSSLILKHINTCFNCCPGNLYIETSTEGNTITIEEFESEAECDCNCLYDIDIKLEGLEAGVYNVVFIEPYINEEQEISFSIDLTTATEGEYCVTRRNYPWGM